MRISFLMKNVFALLFGLLTALNASGQSGTGAAPPARDYSFTISTTQPWTDSGVDLQAGELVEITASPHFSPHPEEGCDPQGVSGSTQGNASLPVATASAGALIAKLQEHAGAVLVGGNRQLKVDVPGHLFFGVNGQITPACTGSFAVKVHVTNAASAPQKAGVGNALPTTSSPASPAAGSTAQTPAAQDIKSKLASAAQVFLAGQFGTGASPVSSSAEPMSNDAVTANSATSTAAAPKTPALSISSAALDAALRKNIDDLPRRVNDQFNNQGDMVNFVLVGSQQQVQSALEAAEWRVADIDNKEAVLKAVLETYQKKDYLQMPMSQLYLFGRKQDFGYELAAAYSVVASRHHFRIWKAPSAWNGQPLWPGAGTHDIGFEKDQRNGSVTHKIDPAVDGERDNIGQTLQQAGKVKSMSYYLPPDPVQGAKNATGGGYHSDGRILVIVLQ
jgi:LssY C-terminus